MFAEYQAGRTPNPDVLCNREIKFDIFWTLPWSLGLTLLPPDIMHVEENQMWTGNSLSFVGRQRSKQGPELFLCQLTQAQLSKALFPIGELLKPEVRAIAKKQG